MATWYGLVPNAADPECGTIYKAIERLDSLWTGFAATTPVEIAHNTIAKTLLDWKARGVPFPGSNPNDVYGTIGLAGLSAMGARPQYLEFPALLQALCPHFQAIDWPAVAVADMRILVGAIEVLSVNFEVFDSDKFLQEKGLATLTKEHDQYSTTRWRMRRAISLEGVAASGTLPDILPAEVIPDTVFPTCQPGHTVIRNGYYWDGLYSQNPPVRDLLDASEKELKPDEIWVVRINPQELSPAWLNVSLEDIRDRENDLAGNLSLNQELDHIMTVNRWLQAYGDTHPPMNNRKIVEVRTIKMTRETAWGLRHTSKFDRSSGHFARLREEGETVAQEWLTKWRTLGKDFVSYPDDARYPEHA